MTLTLSNYAIFSAILIFILYFIVVNINTKKQRKADPKPTIKPMKLFTGNNGLSESKIKEFFKIK